MSVNRRLKVKKAGASSTLRLITIALLALFALVSAGVIFFMYRYQFLGFRGLNHILAGTCLAVFLLALVLIVRRKAKIFTLILLLAGLAASLSGAYGLRTALNLSERVSSGADSQRYQMRVLVLADSPIKTVKELTEISGPESNDGANIRRLLADVKDKEAVSLTLNGVNSYLAAYQQLLAGEVQAIVFNSAFESVLADEDADYASKVKTLYTYTVKQEVTKAAAQAQDVFNIYISGIDTYGDISSVSRSDVNIIMTVNRKTRQVLLTTTPRDAYVAIADGGNNQYDKLTHAGIYGIDASVHTLENLYGIDIDYYVRLNFTSFTKLVDLLGGIQVENDQAFTSLHGNYDFPAGQVTLNADQALAFVRERYALEGGDNARGRNQTKVIAAIINKLTSANALTKAQSLTQELGKAVQTNIALETINSLVNDQLDAGGSYKVTSQSLEGTGTTGTLTSYAMPGAALYMLEINPQSLTEVKAAMENVMEGKAND